MFNFTGAMSKGDQKKFRAQKARTASDLATQEHKRILYGLNEKLLAMRKKYKDALKEQHEQCSNDYADIKARADEAYRQAMEHAKAERDAKKNHKRQKCSISRNLIVAEKKEETAILSEAMREERRYQKEIKQIERANKSREGQRPRASRNERRQESDGEVANNIEPHLLVVWKKVKHLIKANDRRSRTEAFNDWMHEHEDLVQQYQIEEAEKDARKFERENSRKQSRRKSTKEKHAQIVVDDNGDEVPF